MGLDPISIAAIGLGLSAAGAATGAVGAVQQRSNAKEQTREITKAQRANQQQMVNQQQLERQKNDAQAGQLQARLRVLAGESGLALGGSLNDLSNQTEYDRGLNEAISKMNLGNSLNALNSQASAQKSQVMASVQNPILAGLMGGLGGLGAGLSLGSSIDTLTNPLPKDYRQGTGLNTFDEAPRGG